MTPTSPHGAFFATLGVLLLAGLAPNASSAPFGGGDPGTSICTGDGTGATCPCGNTGSTLGGGCQNGSGTNAVLSTNGDNAISSNGISFSLSGASPSSFALLVSGDNALGGGQGIVGMPMADGLRCVGGNAQRHGTRATDLFGDNLNPWGTGVGIIAQSGFVAGQTRHFQARYREDPTTSPCGSDQNTSQGISVTFVQDSEPCTAAVQMACIAAGNAPCTVGVGSADCGPPDPCTPEIQALCGLMNLQPCTPGTGSASCGPPIFSDARLKDIEGLSSRSEDLSVLKRIEITNYTMIDSKLGGAGPQKKVIAQQLEEVYPQAVRPITHTIPEFHRDASVEDSWIQLESDLAVGDRVRLIDGDHDALHEVLEVEAGRFRTDFETERDTVFVYGRKVADARMVDYSALSTLNISATQALAEQVEAQAELISEMRSELERLREACADLRREIGSANDATEEMSAP